MVLRRIFHFVDCFGVLQCVLSRRSSWRVERGQCNVIVPVFFIMIYDLFVWPCGLLALENAKTLREKYDDAVSVGGGLLSIINFYFIIVNLVEQGTKQPLLR